MTSTGTLPPVIRRGAAADDTFSLVVTPETAGWGYSSLRILELPAGGSATFETGEDEMCVLPLAGGCVVECSVVECAGADGSTQRFEITGRDGVFTRVTDFAYVPRDAEVTVSSAAGGRFALPAARATRRLPARYGPAAGVQVELRGAGQASRQVNNVCTPASFEADRLMAVEVLTPSSNWSSFPPHKHDEQRPGESRLEEIYYFEVDRDGPGFQRVYTSGPGREIDICAEVRSGDTILIPHGWHGPSMAAPGYHLYYLNVMAGPSPDREWLICDDPEHAWVRGTWEGQEIDKRLPLTSVDEKAAEEKA